MCWLTYHGRLKVIYRLIIIYRFLYWLIVIGRLYIFHILNGTGRLYIIHRWIVFGWLNFVYKLKCKLQFNALYRKITSYKLFSNTY